MAHQFNPAVEAQLAHNSAMRQFHARGQLRLDQMRMSTVARSTAANAMVQAGGVARNALAGMLPLETSPQVRRQLVQHAGAFTAAKALRADAKARVLG